MVLQKTQQIYKKIQRKNGEHNDHKRAKIKEHSTVWYRRIHDKINFAITVISIAVHWRVKYEQKSRHRYHVYVNLLSKIDEQDVTANIRSLISLSLFPSLSYIAASEYTSAVSTRSALMRFASICFHLEIRVASIFSIYWMHHVLRDTDFLRWSVDLPSSSAHCAHFSSLLL